MSESNLMRRLQILIDNFKKKNSEKDYVLKVEQQNENIGLTIYTGDNKVYLGDYELNYDHFKSELSCQDRHCIKTIEYDIIENSVLNNKVRIQEKYDNHFDHFNVSATFHDNTNNIIGKYQAELSVRFNSAEPEFIIHDLSVY